MILPLAATWTEAALGVAFGLAVIVAFAVTAVAIASFTRWG